MHIIRKNFYCAWNIPQLPGRTGLCLCFQTDKITDDNVTFSLQAVRCIVGSHDTVISSITELFNSFEMIGAFLSKRSYKTL